MGLLVEDLLLLARLDAQRPLERRRVDLLALATDAVHDAQSIAPKRDITHGGVRRTRDPRGARRRGPAAAGAGQPGGQRAAAHPGNRGRHRAGRHRRRQRGARGVRRGPRHDQPRTPTASSSGSTAPTRHARGPAAAPGSGLSIVDSLVYAHGGTVSVTTAPGQGCRFKVNLPRIADVAAQIT